VLFAALREMYTHSQTGMTYERDQRSTSPHPRICAMTAAVQGGQAVLTEDALAEKEAAAKGGDGAAALAGGADNRDSSRARSRRAIEPVSKDQVWDIAVTDCCLSECGCATHRG
jgi:hypothetical protein